MLLSLAPASFVAFLSDVIVQMVYFIFVYFCHNSLYVVNAGTWVLSICQNFGCCVIKVYCVEFAFLALCVIFI